MKTRIMNIYSSTLPFDGYNLDLILLLPNRAEDVVASERDLIEAVLRVIAERVIDGFLPITTGSGTRCR